MTGPLRFSDIARGTAALHAVPLPYGGAEYPLAVRPLSGAETGEAEAAALAYARGKGVPAPRVGDRLYDLGLMAATVAIGCVVEGDAARPFFDGGVEQILASLDADRIALLYEQQQAWEDQCGARASKMDGATFVAKVMEVANSRADEDPLALLRPGMRRDWERTLAVQYIASLQARSSSGPGSEASGTSEQPRAPLAPEGGPVTP